MLREFFNSNFLSYKIILKNTFFLSVIEVVNLLMPFIALPYVIKTIGVDNYGKIIFVQTVIGYFSMLINFGFDIVAVKYVAKNRGSSIRLGYITGGVIAVKFVMSILGLILLTLFISVIVY